MREMILQALKSKISGQINGHIANIEAMMTNPVGIGDHPSIVETIEKELSLLEHENGKLNYRGTSFLLLKNVISFSKAS